MNTFDEVTELIYLRTSAEDITPAPMGGSAMTSAVSSIYPTYVASYGLPPSSPSTSPGRVSPSGGPSLPPMHAGDPAARASRDPCSCIFDAAVDEALDFLVAEIFPAYEKAFPSLGAEDQNSEVSERTCFCLEHLECFLLIYI
jgi:hypothetical protein